MKVSAEIRYIDLESDERPDDWHGDYEPRDIPSVCARCTRCNHEVEIFGDHDDSVRRALATLRQECPKKESNFYEAWNENCTPYRYDNSPPESRSTLSARFRKRKPVARITIRPRSAR